MAGTAFSKSFLVVVVLLVCTCTVASAQPSETRCVHTNRIDQIKRARDGTFIDFQMRGGVTYRNTLRNKCPGLSTSGIGYKTRGTATLCRGETVRVLKTGGVCILGPFVEIAGG